MTEHQLAEGRVDAAHAGMRADRYVAEVMTLFARSQFKQRGVTITVNGTPVKPSRLLEEADVVSVSYHDPPAHDLRAEPLELDIIYEDACVLVVNKPQGMVVHPAAGNWSGTLVHGLLHHVEGLTGGDSGDTYRPGIVHRLDKDTSGVVVTAKSNECQEELAAQFRNRTVTKLYLAILRGTPRQTRGRLETLIARDSHHRKRFAVSASKGKQAVTEYRVLKHFKGYSFVVVHPVTGRTHQIRVHMQHLGCPVLGDPIYARRDPLFPNAQLMLHAYRLTVRLPDSGKAKTFVAPLPDRFKKVLQVLADLPLGTSAAQRPRS